MIHQTKQLVKQLAFLLFFLSLYTQLSATTTDFNPWTPIAEQQFATSDMERQIIPFEYETYHLRTTDLQLFLADTPERFVEENTSSHILVLPMPNGDMERFEVYYAPVLAPELADKYQMIRSYAGVGIDDPTASVRFDVTPFGFHAMILSARHSTVFIDPFAKGETAHYITYYTNDYVKPGNNFECHVGTESSSNLSSNDDATANNLLLGDCRLRTYRLALTCTGEYAQFHGGTIPSVLAAMNTTMTRVNGVFEREVNATMVIVDNNEELIFLDAGTDPYTNNSSGQMIDECHAQCVSIIGNPNFDIGHIFSTGGGGLAGLRVVCRSDSKGRGVTGQNAPIGDPFDIDYVAHEIGHQFGANHTQNNDCNRRDETAMEPGSASTIMGYAGICSPNVQTNSDDYFHAISILEMSNYINNSTGNTCAAYTETGNTPPTVEDVANYTLPVATPFRLTAVGDDADDNAITYCWEQMDNEIATMPPVSTSTGGPAFRSFDPTESPTRYFPSLINLVNNSAFQWEELPSVSREMNFRVTVRDNNMGSGCTAEDDVELEFTDEAGPFLVESPNTNTSWTAGLYENVSWDVANTDAAPVSCAQVDILLSTDGGFTYPITLASGVPNNGLSEVLVPEEITNTARIMVVCSDNIFFDISDQDFSIELSPIPTFALTATPAIIDVCGSQETVDIVLPLNAVLGFEEVVTLSATGLPAQATATFTDNDITPSASTILSIGNLAAVANGTYEITVNGTSESVTMEKTVSLTVANDIPATPLLTMPENGAASQSTRATLNWESIDSATSYELEIATLPGFGDATVETATVAGNSYTTQNLIADNIYYWRVSSRNTCGAADFSEVFAFRTPNCTTYSSSDTPLTIPAFGGVFTLNSILTVDESAPLLRATMTMDVTHDWVGDLGATLTSPSSETTLNLFDRPGRLTDGRGCNEDNLSLVFDDAANNTASDLENTCNTGLIAINGTYQPIDPLANLIGENTQGDWVLAVTDYAILFGGSLDNWSIELCFGTENTEALNLINNAWTVAAGDAPALPNSNLAATSPASAADEISFRLLSLPTEGELSLNGMPLMLGSSFTQADIDNNSLVYTNTNDLATEDQFNFDVQSAAGAPWIPIQTFHINFGVVTVSAAAILTANVSCIGGTEGEITVNASGVNPPFSYSLNGGDPTTENSFVNLPAGSYTVTVLNTNGDVATTNEVIIAEPAAIVVGTTIIDNNVTVEAVGGTGNLLYSIDAINFQQSNSFTDLDDGEYLFIVMDENGCTATSEAITITTVGVSEINFELEFRLFPNPVQGLLSLELNQATDRAIQIQVFDVAGRLVQVVQRNKNNDYFKTTLDVQELPAGSYQILLTDGTMLGKARFVKI